MWGPILQRLAVDAPGDARRGAPEEVAQRPKLAGAVHTRGGHHGAEAPQGGALLVAAVRAAGHETLRERLVRAALPAADAQQTVRCINVDDIDLSLGPDVADLSAGRKLVLLLAEPQRVDERALVDDRWLGRVLG